MGTVNKVSKLGKSLTRGQKKKSGRDNGGTVSVRHRGGGEKRRARKRETRQTSGRVRKRERDAQRTGRVALVKERTASPTKGRVGKTERKGNYKYILAVRGRKPGMRRGNQEKTYGGARGRSKPRKERSPGRRVSNVSTEKGGQGKWRRAAGRSGTVRGKVEGQVQLRRKGGKRRSVGEECEATVGVVAGERRVYGSAGAKRRRGRRPVVRGESMNPVDHPHGGRTRGGRPEKTPWGRRAK